jgi:hypothetical protein
MKPNLKNKYMKKKKSKRKEAKTTKKNPNNCQMSAQMNQITKRPQWKGPNHSSTFSIRSLAQGLQTQTTWKR